MGVKLWIQMMMVVMFVFIKGTFAQNTSWSRVAKPECEERCGSLVVPYPFGIGPNCSAYETMEIYCDYSSNPPKAFSSKLNYDGNNLEVLNISLKAGTIRINYPITSTDCTNRSAAAINVYLDRPFTYSNTENRFTFMGCNYIALLSSTTAYASNSSQFEIGGCVSSCGPSLKKKDNSCFGINCCQTKFPPSSTSVEPAILSVVNTSLSGNCSEGPIYSFIVDQNWFGKLDDIYSVQTMETVPAVLNWRTYGRHCQSFLGNETFSNRSLTLCGINTLCTNQGLCSCIEGYEGNPYLLDGCQDIDECTIFEPGTSLKRNRCAHLCINTPGSYTCSCRDGWRLVANFYCLEVDDRVKKAAIIVIIATCAGLVVLLAAMVWLYKVIRRRNIRRREEKFFKRNGGLLLLQHVSSSQGNVETNKLFTSKELEKATDRYNIDRIVGQGGQGTVYKGMLTDGRIVAVKKSKIEDESKLEQFINEVVILSQINHRNVVKLHGCCLQTEVPLLVYEFIPNGTLMQYIHEENEYFPLTWDVRLRVATEVGGALYYLLVY
ncbi:Wall-associated receptor kinase [Heracleum sosnowskyi]|uniref:Wall-associated receptor kinase n=1 Tax=Heracleum sosnowskyi TaxID=360622 RepID=A0AAD8I310_9APIA|nr:Wall-associated receptor kinase [Heracleum sosnowskyi]